MTTKAKAATGLAAKLDELIALVHSQAAEIAELKAAKPKVSSKGKAKPKASEPAVTEAQVLSLTAEDFETLRYSLVERDSDGDMVLERNEKGSKQYKLLDGVERKWYIGFKGLAQAVARGGIGTEANDSGRSQMDFAREILSECKAAGFINPKGWAKKAAK